MAVFATVEPIQYFKREKGEGRWVGSEEMSQGNGKNSVYKREGWGQTNYKEILERTKG